MEILLSTFAKLFMIKREKKSVLTEHTHTHSLSQTHTQFITPWEKMNPE